MDENKLSFKYKILTCSANDPKELENMLNDMSDKGWDIFNINEYERDNGFEYNVIFMKEKQAFEYKETINKAYNNDEYNDIYDSLGLKTQLDRIIVTEVSPYQNCVEIQSKIKDIRDKISAVKAQIDDVNDYRRNELNQEISHYLKYLEELKQKLKDVVSPDYLLNKIGEEKIVISITSELLKLIDPDFEAPLLSSIVNIRNNFVENLGYIIPKVKFEIDDNLPPNSYSIKIRNVNIFQSTAYCNHLMFYRDELNIVKYPENTIKECCPITGKKIVWIDETKAKDFWKEGKTPENVIALYLYKLCQKNISTIFDYNDVNRYLEKVALNNFFLVENIIPDILQVAELKEILSSLIEENISIKDIVYIFEKINDVIALSDKNELLKKLRINLKAQISSRYINQENIICGYKLNDKLVKCLQSYLNKNSQNNILSKQKLKQIANKIKKMSAYIETNRVIIFTPANIRKLFYDLLKLYIDNLIVLAYEEIDENFKVFVIDEI